MADFIFDAGLGSAAEKVRDDPTKIGALLLITVEADATMKTRATVQDILAHNTEANFSNYTRLTGITATLSIVSDIASLSIDNLKWSDAGGIVNNTLAKLVVFYDDNNTDDTRVPITAHDFVTTTDGNDLIAEAPTGGFYTAAQA